jgi:hypothetical protein
VARPGFAGALLLYRATGTGTLTLEGAVVRGRPVGEWRTPTALTK